MPDMIPVGNTNYVPPPNSGMEALSSILGIQQKKQQLQLQAQDLQRSQLETQQQQGVNQFFSNWNPSEHHGADGTVDIDAVHDSDQYQALPGNARIAVDAKLNGLRGQQLQLKQALVNLNSDAVKGLAQTAQAAAANPAQGPALFKAYADQGPDNARAAATYQPLAEKSNYDSSALKTIADQAQDVASQKEQAFPERVTNAAGVAFSRNKTTGAISEQPGAPSGSRLNPASPQVAAQTAAATTRAGGAGNADIDTSNIVVAAQRDARTNIDLTKRIDQLADIVNPGAAPGKISALLGATGLTDVNQARTELQKDLGRLRSSASSRAGSDSRAAEILSGLPTDTTPTQTIHQAMDVTRGSARQDLALGQLREKAASETKGNMNGFQGDYAHAVGAASPLMHEYLALSPQEQVGFFQRNFKTKEQAKAFRAQVESVKKRSPDVIGQ
jgi:hypothetical protein